MIMHIIGNRPQFIKLAPLFHELQKRGYEQGIIHTGQHYDENMSDVFFRELDIPKPNANLAVGSGSHAEISGKAMIGIERELIRISPRLVIIYGDTDTTLAAAITAGKLGIKIAHVEGATRTHNSNNPEEQNRIVADHLSDIVFAPDKDSMCNAKKEGLGKKTFLTGDIMYDTFLEASSKISHGNQEEFILMTWHRQENTESKDRMSRILSVVEKINEKIICPMHPRTVKCLKQYGLWEIANSIEHLEIIDPVGYTEMVSLMKQAKLIFTDSGGLSRESSYAGVRCLFFVNLICWPDLVRDGWIRYLDVDDEQSIMTSLEFVRNAKRVPTEDCPRYYGNGDTAKQIVDLMELNGYI